VRLIYLLLLWLLPLAANAQLASPNEQGLSYGHVHLNVTDIDTHSRIWIEHFNGVAVQKGGLRGIRLPNMVILFSEQQASAGSRQTVMDHFGVKVRNIQSWIDKWTAAGYEMGPVFTGAEGQTNAYVTLPDGVYVELQEDQGLHEEITGYHVHFYSPRSEQLLDWYTEVFDLEVRPRGSIQHTSNVPGMNLSFSHTDNQRLPTQGTAIDHIGFEVENLEAFCEALAAKGIEFDVPYREIESIGLAIAFITDPQGVRIEFTEGLADY
jgi:catechol 2,3-dioxygenase-like lactoylglutathione lyase family enzyme